jgi:DNA polymerase (family X)
MYRAITVPSNQDVVRILRELVLLTQLEEGAAQSFRIRAYESGVQAVADLARPVEKMSDAELVGVPGIGKGIAARIREYLDTGTIAKVDELRARFPPSMVELTRIPGLGPKTIRLLNTHLGIDSLDGLQSALDAGKIRDVPGLGAKTEDNLRRAIGRLGLHGKERRTPIAEAMPIAVEVAATLSGVPGVTAAVPCGSIRRLAETIGDADVVVATTDAEPVMERFVTMGLVAEVLARGETKTSILSTTGLQVDLRVVRPEQLGAALIYFTGSKAHNIELRQRAIDRELILNEYSLAVVETEDVVASATEEEVYAALDLPWIPPPVREHSGEVSAAARSELPDFVQLSDIKGDLHDHTYLSGDGRASLEVTVEAAAARGLRYLAITDHGEDLPINGATREQLLAQRARIRELQDQYPDLRLLHGCELNIGPDGGLDYDTDFLLGFDWCVASVHSHFDLPVERQTARVTTALRHPAVNVIGHLTGRMIGHRPGIELDLDEVFSVAAETGTGLEINGALERLDVPSSALRLAGGRGVVFVISTDSHHPDDMRRMEWGVLNAQRGWVEKDAIANTWETERFIEWAKSKRS